MTEPSGTPGTGGTPATPLVTPLPATETPWFADLEPETKGWAENRGLTKLDLKGAVVSAIKGHREIEKHVGVPADRLLKLPDNVADAALMAPVYDRLGRPKEATGYEFKVGKTADADEIAFVQSVFHKYGLTKAQGEALFADMLTRETELLGNQEKATKEAEAVQTAALKTEWGANYDRNLEIADRGAAVMAQRIGLTEEEVGTLKTVLGNAKLAKMFNLIGQSLVEDKLISGGLVVDASLTNMSPEAARAKVQELKADQEWVKKYLARDTAAVALWTNLHKIMAPKVA